MRWIRNARERGSAAVEFALVVPVLLLILLGIVEYGRVYFMQNSITNAARVGARAMVVDSVNGIANPAADAKAKAAAAAVAVSPAVTSGQVSVPATCPSGGAVTVTITYPISQLTRFLPSAAYPTRLIGTAQMQCEN
jgi:Flp pilus assembly protein TadG